METKIQDPGLKTSESGNLDPQRSIKVVTQKRIVDLVSWSHFYTILSEMYIEYFQDMFCKIGIFQNLAKFAVKHLLQSIFFDKNVVNITITYIISNILRIVILKYFSKHGDIIINRSQNNVFLCAKILRNRQASDLICTWRI